MSGYVHDLSPYLIQFGGGFGIRWYGLSYLLGFLLGWMLIRKIVSRSAWPVSADQVGDLIFAVAMGTIIGGRLGYCLLYDRSLFFRFSETFPFWGVLELHHGGMASHGGIIGIAAAAYLFAKRRSLNFLAVLDLLALAGPIGVFFGRIANFINGELVGRPAGPDLPWAVRFPQDILSWPYEDPERLKGLSAVVQQFNLTPEGWEQLLRTPQSPTVQHFLYRIIAAVQSGQSEVAKALSPLLTPRHPSQIYEALLEGLVLFMLLLLLRLKIKAPGRLSCAFLVLYALLRIASEQFRMPDPQIGFQLLNLTRGQWLSVAMLAVGVGAFFYLKRNRPGDASAPAR